MNRLEIPPQLEKWLVAYLKVNKFEYDFYFRNLATPTIRIKVVKEERTDKYRSEIKTSDKVYYFDHDSTSTDPDQVLIQSLTRFIRSRLELIHQH